MSAENTPMGSRDEEEPLPAHDQADIDAMNEESMAMNSLSFENFPANGTAVVMRPIIFGPAINEVSLLVTVDPEGSVGIVLGNGPVNEEAPEAAIGLMEFVISLLRATEFQEQWLARLEQMKQEESDQPQVATEPVRLSDLLGNDETGEEIGPDDVRDGREF